MSLNTITLMGRLTRDPELRRSATGTAICGFSIAVDRDYKADGGERQTDFIDIVTFKNTAEFVSKYFSKGRMAVVHGRLQIRDWQDKEGNRRRSAEVVAQSVYFGDSKRPDDGPDRFSGDPTAAPAYPGIPVYDATAAYSPGDFSVTEEEDSEFPF